jgi:general nucleoside transport system ATP-binding protein
MSKSFGALKALQDVSIQVPAGSFHALLGENGAGKSTLVKCIMGFYTPDRGQLLIDGNQVAVRNPRDAQALGVGMVYQHFTLVPALSAAENLVVRRTRRLSSTGGRSARRSRLFSKPCRFACRSTSQCPAWRPARSKSSRS